MPKMKPYHHPDLRTALLDAAVLELRTHGVEGFSLRNISANLGVSHTAPYRHFKDKKELLTALMLDGMKDLSERLNAAKGATPVERLKEQGRAYISFARERPECHSLVFSAAGMASVDKEYAVSHDIRPYDIDAFEELERAVADCQASGDIDPAPRTAALAMVIWSMVYGLSTLINEGMIASMTEARGYDPAETETAIMAALDSLICGMKPRELPSEP